MDEKCAYCGGDGARTHSGILECGRCWDYRKLDRPAALHWAKVGESFLSNVDMYDLMDYLPKVIGLDRDEMGSMLMAAWKVKTVSRYLVENGPRHTWSAEVEAHLEDEMRRRGAI